MWLTLISRIDRSLSVRYFIFKWFSSELLISFIAPLIIHFLSSFLILIFNSLDLYFSLASLPTLLEQTYFTGYQTFLFIQFVLLVSSLLYQKRCFFIAFTGIVFLLLLRASSYLFSLCSTSRFHTPRYASHFLCSSFDFLNLNSF